MLVSRLRVIVAVVGLVCLSVLSLGSTTSWLPNPLTFVNAAEDESRLKSSKFGAFPPSAFVTDEMTWSATPEEFAADAEFSVAAVETSLGDDGSAAGGRAEDKSAAETSNSDDLELTFAQTLSINFHGYREISGDFTVNEDNTVSIPAIGRVDLNGHTAREFEEVLGRKVVQHTGRSSTVNVQVKTFSPIFVTGDVQNSGSFEWRRGMRVLHAKALAGGIFRHKVSEYLDASTAQKQLGNATIRLKHGLAKFERLSAEIEGRLSLNIPDRLVNLVSYDEADQLVRKEEELLRTQSETLKSNLAALKASYEAAKIEITRLNELDRSLEGRVKEQTAHMNSVKRIFDKGHTTALRMFNLRSQLAEMESRLASVKVSKAQAEAALLSIKRDQIELTERRMAKLVSERLDLSAQIQKYEVDLKGALALGNRIEKAAAAATGGLSDGSVQETYEIVRNTGDGEAQKIKATQLDRVLPGDVVRVKLRKSGQSDSRLGSLDGSKSLSEKSATLWRGGQKYVAMTPDRGFSNDPVQSVEDSISPQFGPLKWVNGIAVPPLPIPRQSVLGDFASVGPGRTGSN